jgi:hypothetical protein
MITLTTFKKPVAKNLDFSGTVVIEKKIISTTERLSCFNIVKY